MQLSLLTLTITYMAWPVFSWKGLSLYFFFWGVFEIAYRMRKRQALVCESCGFDPFLYKQDVHKARKALRKHWEQRIEAENLFSGKKLKNYTTKPLNQPAAPAASVGENKRANAGVNSPAP